MKFDVENKHFYKGQGDIEIVKEDDEFVIYKHLDRDAYSQMTKIDFKILRDRGDLLELY